MRLQDHIVRRTQKAMEDICRSASEIPAEKLNWTPGGESRSVLDQMKEVCQAPNWLIPVIKDGQFQAFDAHPSSQEGKREMPVQSKGLDTLEGCIGLLKSGTSELCRLILRVPDENFEKEVKAPWGAMVTVSDILAIHEWNLVYHLGQINQISLIFGDREMH